MSLIDILEHVRPFVPLVLSLLLAIVALIGWKRHREMGFLVLGLWAPLLMLGEIAIRFGFHPAQDFLIRKIGQNGTAVVLEIIIFFESLLYQGGLLVGVALLVFRRKGSRGKSAD